MARGSIIGGVADGFTLKPEPGNLRAGGRVAEVGVPAALPSSMSRAFPFALSSFDGIAMSDTFFRALSPVFGFLFFVITTPFFSAAGALDPEAALDVLR